MLWQTQLLVTQHRKLREVRVISFTVSNHLQQRQQARIISFGQECLSLSFESFGGRLADLPFLPGGLLELSEDFILRGREGVDVDELIGSLIGLRENRDDGVAELAEVRAREWSVAAIDNQSFLGVDAEAKYAGLSSLH